ncbi:hypothetical protein M885DRAFT_573073 [Pelagophyceae sp. CCMP2097]|nr:hypothetical protein M885DRAFT_573073 [Pelagophyceae sp. CCMP2097]
MLGVFAFSRRLAATASKAPLKASLCLRACAARHGSSSSPCRALPRPSDDGCFRHLLSSVTTTNMPSAASASCPNGAPASLAARLSRLKWGPVGGSLEELKTACLPRFDIVAVYDETFKQRTIGLKFPKLGIDWGKRLNEVVAAPLLRAANKLRIKHPEFGGPCFTTKKAAIRCLLDERDGLSDVGAFYEACPKLAAEYSATLGIVCTLLDLDEHDARRQHLLRHHAFWNHAENGAYGTQQLINALRERTHLRELGPDVHYGHLDDLKDPQGTSELAVLRSKHAIGDAGKRLRNCALSYASQVKSRTCVLFDMSLAKWVSIRENCNGIPTDATRAAFTGYTAAIQAWRPVPP